MAVCTCLGCGPAGTIDGELRADDPSAATTNDHRQDPVEMEESKPTCITPALTSLRADLFVPVCGQCHAGSTPAQDLDLTLDEAALRMRLLQPASESPSGLPLVMPGAIGSSYLYLKVAVKTPLIGDRMPRDSEALSDCTVESVRRWIADGAN